MSEEELNEVTEKVKEYAELTKTIKLTQEKLKILNKKKRELHKEVIPKLKNVNVTKCNLSFGTLKVNKSRRKILPTKTTIQQKYVIFFQTRSLDADFIHGNAELKGLILYKFLYVDNVEFKEQHSISMIYNKEFKEQCKQLTGMLN